jgi:glucosyl-dolichyl phosphate glucuronosyltransferase
MACDISVIVCAYTEDRWSDLVAAVASVKEQTLSPAEIIVVIDHNPALLEQTKRHLPDIVVVHNKEARGASGARNTGIAIARGQIIACLDDDAIASKDWLKCLYLELAATNVLGVGGAIYPLWQVKRPPWFPEEFDWVVGCSYRGMPRTVTPVRNLIGANMAIRHEVFDKVGYFRSEIGRIGTWPIGCEETELCIRALQRLPQHVFLYQPQASVCQRVPVQRAKLSYFCSRCYAEGLSKALVTQFVGLKDGLASERSYTLKILPRGIARAMSDVLFRRDLTGLLRVGAIVLGLFVTTTGYLAGTAFLGRQWLQEKIHSRQATRLASNDLRPKRTSIERKGEPLE